MLGLALTGFEQGSSDDVGFFLISLDFQLRCLFCASIASGRSPFLAVNLCCWLTRLGVMLASSLRTIACTPVCPSRDSNSRLHH